MTNKGLTFRRTVRTAAGSMSDDVLISPFVARVSIGDDCANALYTPNHTPVITNAIERIDLALDNPRGHPDLNTRMRRDRQNLARLRRELTTAEDDD